MYAFNRKFQLHKNVQVLESLVYNLYLWLINVDANWS